MMLLLFIIAFYFSPFFAKQLLRPKAAILLSYLTALASLFLKLRLTRLQEMDRVGFEQYSYSSSIAALLVGDKEINLLKLLSRGRGFNSHPVHLYDSR
jgi:uncharacterized membrane protein